MGVTEIKKELNLGDKVTVKDNIITRESTEAERNAEKALKDIKAEIKNLKEEDYKPAAWNKLQKALEKPETNLKEINAKTEAIKAALENLKNPDNQSDSKKIEEIKVKLDKYEIAVKELEDAVEGTEGQWVDAENAISKSKVEESELNGLSGEIVEEFEETITKLDEKVEKAKKHREALEALNEEAIISLKFSVSESDHKVSVSWGWNDGVADKINEVTPFDLYDLFEVKLLDEAENVLAINSFYLDSNEYYNEKEDITAFSTTSFYKHRVDELKAGTNGVAWDKTPFKGATIDENGDAVASNLDIAKVKITIKTKLGKTLEFSSSKE